MNFGRLMLLYSFTTPLGCGAKAGWDAHRWLGVLLGIAIGIVVGIIFSYIAACELTYMQNHKELSKPILAGAWQLAVIGIVVGLIIQMFLAAFIAMWLTGIVSARVW